MLKISNGENFCMNEEFTKFLNDVDLPPPSPTIIAEKYIASEIFGNEFVIMIFAKVSILAPNNKNSDGKNLNF